jgi:hypothetical protein
LFVVLDSDARFPGHVTTESGSLMRLCRARGVPIVLLAKRAIENYISDQRLQEYAAAHPDVQPAVDFVLALRTEQRDHFPIKDGIAVHNGTPVGLSDQEAELYADVVWPAQYKPKLPRIAPYVLAQDPPVTPADLHNRGATHEVSQLAARLNEEI